MGAGNDSRTCAYAAPVSPGYIEDIRYVPAEYNTPRLLNVSVVRGKKHSYISTPAAFDIETSTITINGEPEAIMYVWMFQYDGVCYVGRTWECFRDFIGMLSDRASDACSRLVVYVHNLSYEYQFLRTVLDFESDNVFCVKSRKILRAIWQNIEFRCSYLLSNMSLAEYTKKMEAHYVKQSGNEFGYDKIRYPWDSLTEKELKYCIWDVAGLLECIDKDMELESDTVATIPLTSTGYVRRDVKRGFTRFVRSYIKDIQPSYDVYQLCRECFRGGNTHANRYYTGRVLHNVYSADRVSSYPDVQINDKFPVTPFEKYDYPEVSIGDIERLKKRRGKAMLFRVTYVGLRLRDPWWGCPYLSLSKTYALGEDVGVDNGRVLYADSISTSLTDIDWDIMESEYTYDEVYFKDVYISSYGKLPTEMLDVVRDYFHRKTTLKDVAGQEIFYMKSKNKLNSIYGMTAQDPGKVLILDKDMEYVKEEISLEEAFLRGSSRAVLPYQWGVWTTAWARYRLEEGIRLAGDSFVYCDTDSVKSLKAIDWEAYNEERKKASIQHNGVAKDIKGHDHYLGIYENEGVYERFITWGAKKYAYEQDGKLSVTISGVSKRGARSGSAELEERGGIDALRPGFAFRKAGGMQLVYNDHPMKHVELQGHMLAVPSNVVIQHSTYRLSITRGYAELIGFFE